MRCGWILHSGKAPARKGARVALPRLAGRLRVRRLRVRRRARPRRRMLRCDTPSRQCARATSGCTSRERGTRPRAYEDHRLYPHRHEKLRAGSRRPRPIASTHARKGVGKGQTPVAQPRSSQRGAGKRPPAVRPRGNGGALRASRLHKNRARQEPASRADDGCLDATLRHRAFATSSGVSGSSKSGTDARICLSVPVARMVPFSR